MKSFACIAMVFVTLLICGSFSITEASEFLGDYYWNVNFTTGQGATGILKLGVTWMGGAHYSISGLLTQRYFLRRSPLLNYVGVFEHPAE